MEPWIATIIGAGLVILVQLLTSSYIYGQLTQTVKGHKESLSSQESRIRNAETVLSGPGGHGERLTALEAWRIEHRGQLK